MLGRMGNSDNMVLKEHLQQHATCDKETTLAFRVYTSILTDSLSYGEFTLCSSHYVGLDSVQNMEIIVNVR